MLGRGGSVAVLVLGGCSVGGVDVELGVLVIVVGLYCPGRGVVVIGGSVGRW